MIHFSSLFILHYVSHDRTEHIYCIYVNHASLHMDTNPAADEKKTSDSIISYFTARQI